MDSANAAAENAVTVNVNTNTYFKAFLNITPSLRVLMSCDADLNNIWQDVKKKMLLNPNVIKKS